MASEYVHELTDLEKKVIIRLAISGPMSGYDFHLGGKPKRGSRKALMSSGYWPTVKKHLGPDGLDLITKVKLRGKPKPGSKRAERKRKLYWLTDKGVVAALENNVNPKVIKQNIKRVYGKNEDQEALCDLTSAVGITNMKIIIELNEKIRPDSKLRIVARPLYNKRQAIAWRNFLRKYPKLKEQNKILSKVWRKRLREEEKLLE